MDTTWRWKVYNAAKTNKELSVLETKQIERDIKRV